MKPNSTTDGAPVTRTKRTPATKREPRAYRLGDIVLRLAAPARAGDQPQPVPGTRWAEVPGGGCLLVLVDAGSYVGFVSGRPLPGRHLHHRRP